MKLDRTMTLGNIITLVTMLAGLWAATTRIENRLTQLEIKVDALWQDYVRQRTFPLPQR